MPPPPSLISPYLKTAKNMARTKSSSKRKPPPLKKRVIKTARKSAPATANYVEYNTFVSYYTVRLSYPQGKTAGLTLFNAKKCVALDDDHRAPIDEESDESDRDYLYEKYDRELNFKRWKMLLSFIRRGER